MFVQAVDNYYYKGFYSNFDKCYISSEAVYTLTTKKETIKLLDCWPVKLLKSSKTTGRFLGGMLSCMSWTYSIYDRIPVPQEYDYRTLEPIGEYKSFLITLTPEELEDLKKKVYSFRIKEILGGLHLSNLSLARRLKKCLNGNILRAY